jgi:hypothetical protein
MRLLVMLSGQILGWRAADSGAQTIRLVFDESQRLKRIALVFEETRAYPRVLCSGDYGGARFKRLCASRGISVPERNARSRGVSG